MIVTLTMYNIMLHLFIILDYNLNSIIINVTSYIYHLLMWPVILNSIKILVWQFSKLFFDEIVLILNIIFYNTICFCTELINNNISSL